MPINRQKSLRRKQGGWIALVAAAIGAAAAAKASADARRARLGAQQQQTDQAAASYAQQKEFAQNAIQWRVEDAKKAGLHPLYALTGGGASYTPPSYQAFGYDPSPTLSLGRSLGEIGGQVAGYYSRQAQRDSGELYGPPDSLAPDDVAYSLPVTPYNETPGFSVEPSYLPPVAPYGMTSVNPQAAMTYWDVPQIGRIIAPAASNFSESLEGLESPIGQGIILYLNKDLGRQGLEWLQGMMPKIAGWTLDNLLSKGSDVIGEMAKRSLEATGRWADSHRRP